MRLHELMETSDHVDLQRLTDLVIEFRERMEREPIDDFKRADFVERNPYYRFFGQCNMRSKSLAAFLQTHGFPARTVFGNYRVKDARFIQDHGAGIHGWGDGDLDGFPDEDHEWVQVGPYYIDVTADQFHPSDPQPFRVVIAHKIRDKHHYV